MPPEKRIPMFNRILFRLILPIVVVGLLCSTLFVYFMSSPIKRFLIQQFDANLRVSSIMGLQICDEGFNYLLDLRLERDPEMNEVMKQEALDKIKAVSGQFPRIHILVLKEGKQVKASSLKRTVPDLDTAPVRSAKNDTQFAMVVDARRVRAHLQYFPFWEWHVVSFVFEDDFQAPIRMAYRVTYLSAGGVFVAVFITLLGVFHLFIRKPLNQLIASTDGVADGKLYKIENIEPNEFGRLMVSFNTMIDSLEKEQAEVRSLIDQLKESEALFRSQFEFGNIGIAIIYPDERNWVTVNEKFCRILGYGQDEIYDFLWVDLVHPGERKAQQQILGRFLSNEIDSYEYDSRLSHKDGRTVYIHISLSCLRNDDHSIKYIIASVLDISDRLAAEREKEKLSAQLVQVQKMEAIGTLAGGIAHDFNNILSGIFGFSQLAINHIDEPEKASDDIEKVIKGASRAAELVQQILTFSRRQDYSKQYLKLSVVVREVVKLIRSTIPTSIEIIEEIHTDGGIIADTIRIHQMIMNLCTNAYHAMIDTGGQLTVKLSEVYDGQPYLELEICDTGHGMDKIILSKIFEPYFTTKAREKGTGLGLALVHAIVEEHNGLIDVSSEVGKGTCFKALFPVAEKPQAESREEKKPEQLPTGNESILFVDDEESIRLFNQSFLQKCGYTVSVHENGETALRAFEQAPDQYDLVITDMAMPKMDGRVLAKKILEIQQQIPIILCTGFSENFDEEQATRMGITRYIQKPIDARKMCHLVREILDEKPGR